MNLDQRIDFYYNKMKGLPNGGPVVRENIPSDAFPIVALEILYDKDLNLGVANLNATDIAKMVVPPPDGGIDIVVSREDTDETFFDFIQVKNSVKNESEIKSCFATMRQTITDYLDNPASINNHLSEVLQHHGFDKSNMENIKYIVIHRGNVKTYSTLKDNEQIVTGADLDVIALASSREIPCVPKEEFKNDSFNNFIIYEPESKEEEAILCNFRGYELAVLSNKYSNTAIGRNILFGQNLRESLGGKSKTYDGIKDTIDSTPDRFWFYNNGITIIAENYDTFKDVDGNEKIQLRNFSIINGAQTTSSLGQYLRDAELKYDVISIEKLKKVYVLTRILKVKDNDLKDKIAIYNNTQNPITTRDMASNREEQRKLYYKLLNENNIDGIHIYVEIRNGSKVPANIKIRKHQKTSNTELAQLAFAGFLQMPYTAKNKKNALFDTDYKQPQYLINKNYQKVFFYSDDPDEKKLGILFKYENEHIDELLFVNYLYKKSKNLLRKHYAGLLEKYKTNLAKAQDEDKKEKERKNILNCERRMAINNICLFYCMALYYRYKQMFFDEDKSIRYDYDAFYKDKLYEEKLVKEFANLFLKDTISIIYTVSAFSANLNTWVRSEKSEQPFLDELEKIVQEDEMDMSEKYNKYLSEFHMK